MKTLSVTDIDQAVIEFAAQQTIQSNNGLANTHGSGEYEQSGSSVNLPDSLEKCHQIMKGLRLLVLLRQDQFEKKIESEQKSQKQMLDINKNLTEQLAKYKSDEIGPQESTFSVIQKQNVTLKRQVQLLRGQMTTKMNKANIELQEKINELSKLKGKLTEREIELKTVQNKITSLTKSSAS